jgi:phosphatidylinositol alpha-1,6-mannosyltransferase
MPKRLIYMSTEFPPGPGGIATHTYQVAMGLQKRDWEVIVLSTQDDATDAEINAFNKDQPFRVVRLRRWSFALVEGFYRLLVLFYWYLRFRPHAGLACGERAVWLMAVLGRITRMRWLGFGIATEFTVPIPWVRAVTRWAFNGAHSLAAISDDGFFRVLESGRARAFRQRFGLEPARLLLTVGRVTERKGQDVVIRALPYILDSGLDVHYLMAGVPILGPQMEALAQELGVADKVHLLGRLDDETVVDAYNACDVFVMTSRHTESGDFEGFGIAAVEAALCGKPAVVSGESGLTDAVIDGVTALVVPLHDPQATAQAIISLLKDTDLYRHMADQARQHALQVQTWNQRLDEIHDALQTMLGVSA